jgi:outer membrane protein OmpA-like peptidoglycan-associated protein
MAANLTSARGYILALTGRTDSVGDATYNYQLSQRRADAVANYLQSKYNIPPHKFYLVGIGKDQQVASDSTAAGRAKNRRVEIKLLSNMSDQKATASSTGPNGQ